MKKKQNINSKSLLILVVIILINFLSYQFFFRIDLTEDGQYSLSKATKGILKDLDETITITAYFTGDLPPQFLKIKNDFRDLLSEYASASGGNILYEFVDPNKSQDMENQALQNGIRPVIINAREKDQVTQKKVYLGAVLRLGEEKGIIPLIQPESSMEFDLSTAIKKLSVKDKPKIGYIQGQGSPSLNALQQVNEQLQILYDIVPVNIADSGVYLAPYKALMIVAPRDSFPQKALNNLDKYLAGGGNLFIALNRVEGDMSNATGKPISTGLESWLADKGIVVEDNFIVDASCGNVSVRQQQMGFTMTTAMPFPYLPVVVNFENHPITKGLESVLLPFASPVSYSGDTTVQFTPIAWSSKQSGTQATPVYFDINKRWNESDFTRPGTPVAGIVSGNISGNTPSKIVIIGDGDFPVNGEGQRAQQVQPDNVSLMVNSVEWLTDETGLIGLRTKEVTSRPLDQVSDAKKVLMRWMNFLVPILVIVIYGILRYQRRRIIRSKRMEEGYV
ncbi:MAG: Gldg family protein [Bacteroidetes bacterium]|nr:Gldg family protein [Bacteroidota bacterium]